MEEKLEKLKNIVEKELSCSAHDLEHSKRVYSTCLKLAQNENVDLNVLKAAALLHDIARVEEDNDKTGNTDHAILGAKKAEIILKELDFPEKQIQEIIHCILSHRFRNNQEPQTKEAQILFDADKLDSCGALSIARGFIWVGRNNAKLYTEVNIDEYIKDNLGGEINGKIKDKTKHSVQIEYENKIKRLGDKLYSQKAKEIYKERISFCEEFLKRLEKEIKGEI
ncbi:MAG: HD domain-containing protein [Candidatus Pacebacteria bacterium]|nr:HD domain-containing protein [Candidatus Paceibacterota bacterium]MDD5752743.1 HD domain-containing protein [Candidatus Paceibacterota bacterium]